MTERNIVIQIQINKEKQSSFEKKNKYLFQSHNHCIKMNNRSIQYKEINKFLSSFTILEHSQGSTVLASQQNTYLVRHIDISSSDEQKKQQEMNDIISTLSQHQSMNCKHILPLIDFEIIFNKTKTHSQIRAIYQHGCRALSRQIQDRIQSEERFEEEALWSIVYSLALPLAYLQEKSIVYGVLDASRVFLDNDVIAIVDPSSTGIDPYQVDSNRLYSPELLKSEINYDQIDMFKSDVFVLGLLMLQCASLKMEIYDYDENILRISLDEIKDVYSQNFCQLLQSMLSFTSQQRPSFSQILSYVNELFQLSNNQTTNIQESRPDEENQSNQICELNEYSEKQNIDILQTEYIRFEDNHNQSSIDSSNPNLSFYQQSSRLNQSPIIQGSQNSENGSLFIEESMIKPFQKSRRIYKPKQIKQKLIKNDYQFQSADKHTYDSQSNYYANKNIDIHRRSKTNWEEQMEKTNLYNNPQINVKKQKDTKENHSKNHHFYSKSVFSPLNKENLFTKPQIMSMIKNDIKKIEERKKRFLNVNFSYVHQNQQNNMVNRMNNQKNEKNINNQMKASSFHQASLISSRK